MISLVVNADDFGQDSLIDEGILFAHRHGIVTSTSLLGNCTDVSAAKAKLDLEPRLGVGAQLTLSGGAPVLAPLAVRSLVNGDGQLFRQARDVFVCWAKGDLVLEEVEREFDAQLGRLRDHGIQLDHINTRGNVGFIPSVSRILEALVRRHGIAGLRSTVEKPSLSWFTDAVRGGAAAALGGLSWWARRQMGPVRHGPLSWGYMENGRLDEIRIIEILGRLGAGSHELICHPGSTDEATPASGVADGPLWPIQRRLERDALCSDRVRHALAHRAIRLCRWADLF